MTALLVTLCNLRLSEALNINTTRHDRTSRPKTRNTIESSIQNFVDVPEKWQKVDGHFANMKFNLVYYW